MTRRRNRPADRGLSEFHAGKAVSVERADPDLYDMRQRLPLNNVQRYDALGVVHSRTTAGAIILAITQNTTRRTAVYVAQPQEIERIARDMLRRVRENRPRRAWWRVLTDALKGRRYSW